MEIITTIIDTVIKLIDLFVKFFNNTSEIIKPITDAKDIIAFIIKAPYIIIGLIFMAISKFINWIKYGN